MLLTYSNTNCTGANAATLMLMLKLVSVELPYLSLPALEAYKTKQKKQMRAHEEFFGWYPFAFSLAVAHHWRLASSPPASEPSG